MDYLVKFDSLPWETPMAGVRHKIYSAGDQSLRLVEYAAAMAPHWCSRGHIGQILDGRIDIEFQSGTLSFAPGDGVFIPEGKAHEHRARPRSAVVRAIFIEVRAGTEAPPISGQSPGDLIGERK